MELASWLVPYLVRHVAHTSYSNCVEVRYLARQTFINLLLIITYVVQQDTLGGCGPQHPNVWTHRATHNLHIPNQQHTVYRRS
jgi:hypothetical protein